MLRLSFLLLFSFFFIQLAFAQQDSVIHDDITFDNIDSISFNNDYDADGELPASETLSDTLSVQPRHFDESTLEELHKDKDFNYSEAPTVGESLWERFWRWLMEILGRILRGAVTTDWGRLLLYAGGLLVIIFIVMALLKVDAFKVLFKGADASSSAGIFHEDIHVMDFEALLREAVEKKDFRNAVRLVFLYSLKLLSDGQHIHWQAGKTNHDYLEELTTLELKPGLGELSFYFDYAWYGGFSVSETQFARVKSIFENWKGAIQ